MDPLDPAWAHCDSVKGLRSTMICRYCHKKIDGSGITGVKYHLAGLQSNGSACESVPDKVKTQMVRLIKGGPATSRKKAKKGKKKSNLTVAFLKACENSKKIKKDKVTTSRSTDSSYASPRPGSAMSSLRRIYTRSRRDNKLDTNMFEALMEDLWREVPEEKRRYFICFDSLWFCSYQEELKSKDELRKNKILEWIKNKGVFSKKYVFVPIVCWDHWSLLILCHFGDMNHSPCMLLLDSLLDAGPKRLENNIRRFVSDIYRISGRKQDESFISDIPFLIPKVPQQTDDEECGKLVLYFMFRFIESCPDTVALDGYPYFLTEEWFTREEFEKFSRELESSLRDRKERGKEPQQSSDNVDPPDEVHTSELVKNIIREQNDNCAAVIVSDKSANPGKPNSSSSVECITEAQDPSQRLASVTREKHQPLPSQTSEKDQNISPLLKNLPIWQHIQTLEVFKQIPQQPHFRKLESYCQDVREGMAIGLMVTYANVATSIDKISFNDDVAVFEQKITCLDTLEENGFNVGQLRSRLQKLLKIKIDHAGNHLKRAELEAQLAQKESANASVLLELDKVGLELMDLRKKLNILTEQRGKLVAEGDQISKVTAGLESEILKLKDQLSNATRLSELARENFEKLLAEPL